MEASTTSALAGAFNSVGSLVGGFQQASADKANAKVADDNAGIAIDQAAQKAAAVRRDAVRLRGAQSAAAGASGITQDGSVQDVMADSATEAELDALNAIYEGKMAARSYKSQGRAYRSSAKSAVSSGLVGAGSYALSGYNNWKNAKAYEAYLAKDQTVTDPMVGRTRIDQ